MIKYGGSEVAKDWEEEFGFPITEISVRGMWILVKLFKHARGRCRSNKAMDNWLSSTFTGHTFKEVPKKNERTGDTYLGLEINKNDTTIQK